jgi:uncharacterized protein
MAPRADDLDLGALRLAPGEGRRLEFEVAIEPLLLGEEIYRVEPPRVPVKLEVSRMAGHGYALHLSFEATLSGQCMRCLGAARPLVSVTAREVDVADGGEELASPYVHDETLDLAAWARDAFVLAAPLRVICAEECAGLCPECAANLNEAGPEHSHPRDPDPRWDKLRELRLE